MVWGALLTNLSIKSSFTGYVVRKVRPCSSHISPIYWEPAVQAILTLE